MQKIPILFDVDPGIDDAAAFLFALGDPHFDVLGITTNFGNRACEVTTRNTLKLLELCKRTDIRVAKGADKPLMKEKIFPEVSMVHGKDGFGDIDTPLPEPTMQLDAMNAVDLMADVLRSAKEPVYLVPVAPLTNIAAFLLAHPELKHKIKQIAIMGGAGHLGNATPVAEANIYNDPEAAKIVLNSGVDILFCGLDITYNGFCTAENIQQITAIGTPPAVFMGKALGFYSVFYKNNIGLDGCALHDSVPLAVLAYPEIAKTVRCNVDVDLEGRYTFGSTPVDFRGISNKPKNADVGVYIDREKYINLIINAIKNLG